MGGVPILIKEKTRELLKAYKQYNRETYDDTINRILKENGHE